MITTGELANKIRENAEKKGISVRRVLMACDINKNFIYDLEHTKSIPSYDKIVKLAEVLDVSVGYLLGETEFPHVLNEREEKLLLNLRKLDTSDFLEVASLVNTKAMACRNSVFDIAAESGMRYTQKK